MEYAYNLCLYLKKIHPESNALKYFQGIETLLNAYRSLDWIPKLSRFSPVSRVIETRKIASQIQKDHQRSWNHESSLGLTPTYQIFNDNRHEQHSFLWFTDVDNNS